MHCDAIVISDVILWKVKLELALFQIHSEADIVQILDPIVETAT